MNRKTFGDCELTVVSDGIYHLDGGAFFGVIPKVLWQKKLPADEKNRVSSGLNSLVIRTGNQTILVETGIGSNLTEKMIGIYGQPAQLLENLQAAGVSPDEVDIVINTHLHGTGCCRPSAARACRPRNGGMASSSTSRPRRMIPLDDALFAERE